MNIRIEDMPGYIPPEDAIETRYDTLGKVLQFLRPGCEFIIRGNSYEDIEWLSKDLTKPTEEEISNKKRELFELWENHRYKRKRRLEYPSWEELADAIYHKEKGDNSKMDEYIAKLDVIKNKHQKPNQ